MVSKNLVRCVNKTTNKVRYFSKSIVNDPLWRKNTGFEIQEIDQSIDEGWTAPAKIEPKPVSLTKPKRKYTKKQPA